MADTPPPDAAPKVRRPRRRRVFTGPLFAWAALLGILAGAGTGYAIQAARPEIDAPPLLAKARQTVGLQAKLLAR